MSYPEQVKSAYYKMCEDPLVSFNLKKPTPLKLKKQCLAVYKKKNSIRDQHILKDFLEINDEVDDLASTIKNFDLEKFRPPVNFLIGKTTEPRDETIEFVAWLIDFKFNLEDQEVDIDEEKEDIEESDDKVVVIPFPTGETKASEVEVDKEKGFKDAVENKKIEDADSSGEGGKITDLEGTLQPDTHAKPSLWKKLINSKAKKAVFSSMVAISATCTGFYLYPLIIDPKCMYWTGDHYKPISCEEKKEGVEIIAFNEIKARDFKRITQPDTITLNSIGKVFYSKINNQVEFFTSKGKHPVNDDRILKPVTQHIIETYARNNSTIN